jgi:hypothetical protein
MMKREERLPSITFSDDADYETVVSVAHGWCAAFVLTMHRRVLGEVIGMEDDCFLIHPWNETVYDWDRSDIQGITADEVISIEIL